MTTVAVVSPLAEAKANIRSHADSLRGRVRVTPPGNSDATNSDPSDPDEFFTRRSYRLAELTNAPTHEFIDRAYRALLKRSPDPAGVGTYLQKLLHGIAKAEVLGELRWSTEGRKEAVEVRGLRLRYLIERSLHIPVLGYLLGIVLVLVGLPRFLRYHREAETFGLVQLDMTRMGLARDKSELVARLDSLATEIRNLQSGLSTRIDGVNRRVEQMNIGALRAETKSLRHEALSTKHWLASLQQALREVEAAEGSSRERLQATEADLDVALAESPRIVAADIEQLNADDTIDPAHPLLILECGRGDTLDIARSIGVEAIGVTSNPNLAVHCIGRGFHVSSGSSQDILRRLADSSCGAILAPEGLATRDLAELQALLASQRRVLVSGGRLRIDAVISRGVRGKPFDAAILREVAQRAGLRSIEVIEADASLRLDARSA